MPGFFYNLGRSVRAGAQKAKWVFSAFTGTDEDAIRAERDAGVEMARAFEQETKLDEDEDIAALLRDVGKALRKCAKNKHRKFTFKAVAMPEPNAFALPGGFIYVTRALIDLCGEHEGAILNPASTLPAPVDTPVPVKAESQRATLRDELAFILGHEMGHVVRGHAMQRMVNSTLVNTAARAVPIGGMVGKMVVRAGSQVLSSAYSQDHELEADAFGLRIARAAGFDEAAAVTMMRRLQKRGGDHPEDSLGAYFATHPPFEVRIRHLKKAMK